MPTLMGRITNVMSRKLPGLGKAATRRQVEQFRSSNGSKGNKIMGRPVFMLEVVGRSSGELRPVMLMLARDGDDLLVVGSHGGHPETPNWYRNLIAAGTATVQVDQQRWNVTAHELPDGPERDRAWAVAAAAYPDFNSYQELTSRRIPIAALRRADPVPS